MFQLIVVVVAVLIAVLITVAAIWFGGSVFTSNSGRANLATYESASAQIEDALNIYYSDNGYYPSGTSDDILQSLVNGGYLTQVPQPGGYVLYDQSITLPLSSMTQCYQINLAAQVTHINECPACADDTKGNYPGCTQ